MADPTIAIRATRCRRAANARSWVHCGLMMTCIGYQGFCIAFGPISRLCPWIVSRRQPKQRCNPRR